MFLFWWTFLFLMDAATSVRTDPKSLPEVIFSESKCRILINEFNVYTTEEQYIEISKYCMETQKSPRTHNMKLFRLVFINHLGQLIGVCKLRGFLKKPLSEKYYYYIIGRGSSTDVDYDIDDCEIPSIDIQNPTKRVLPKGINYPIGLGLIYNEREETLNRIQLKADGLNYKKVEINSSLQKLLVKSLIDFYVYGSSTQYVYCEYFNKLYSGYNEVPNPILRDWGEQGGQDVSLSRCGSDNLNVLTLPFQHQLWLYTSKTPGRKNSCKTGTHFAVEEMPSQRKRPRTDYVLSDGETFECRSVSQNDANEAGLISFPNEFQAGINMALDNGRLNGGTGMEVGYQHQSEDEDSNQEDNFNDNMEDEPICLAPLDAEYVVNTCSTEEQPPDPSVDVEQIIDVEDADETQIPDDPTIDPLSIEEFDRMLQEGSPYMYENCTGFDYNILDHLEGLPFKPYDSKDIVRTDVCTWIEVTPKHQIRCKFCNRLIKQGLVIDRPKSKRITKIMTHGIGILNGDRSKYYNRQYIQAHLKNPIHKISLDFYDKVDEGKRTEDIILEMKTHPGPYLDFYNQTLSMFKTAYQAVRMGLTFYKFSILLETLKHFGVPLGHLYSNDGGMQVIIKSIAYTMHKDLVAYLLREQPKIAIILDELSDVSTKSILGICFQTLTQDKEVKVFLYRLIDLQGNQTGASIFSKFKDSVRSDGLEGYLTENLVGMATDGGSNFRQTFRAHLKLYVHNELIAIHCNCHVLERVHFHAIKQFPDLRMVDKKTNDIFRLFNSHSAKRKNVLEFMIIDQNDSHFEVKRIQTIRWVASKYRALKNVLLHWKTILMAVRQITNDKGWDASARLQSKAIEEYLLDPVFLATVAFSADVAKILSDISLAYQRRGFSVILVKDKRERLLESLELMGTEDGPYLSKFYSSVRVNHPDETSVDVNKRSIETEPLIMEGIELNVPKLGSNGSFAEFCSKYVEAIKEQVSNYYPGDIQDSFWILDPLKLQSMVQESEFNCDELYVLNEKLHWGYSDETLCASWVKLVQDIVQRDDYNVEKENSPEKFWPYFLTATPAVSWTDDLQNIVSIAISQPGTSAEIERVFSLYSATKTLRRYSLQVETVEAIIRIRFNGVTNVTEINTDGFLKDFLEKHSRVDDVSRREKWVSAKNLKVVPQLAENLVASEDNDVNMNGDDEN